jgi:DNA-binding IclR family transcriptional regulator
VTPEVSQTLDRGLSLLRLLAAAPDGLTISQLAEQLGVGRTVVYRLVGTLEQHDLVRRDDGGRVVMALGILGLARAVQPQARALTVPILRRLANDAGATAHLTVAEGDEGFVLAAVEPSWTHVHVAYRVGARHPLARGAAGRAILAGRRGEHDAVTSAGELQQGASGVAAPVLGVVGLEASVGVVSLEPLDVQRVGPLVITAAADLSQQLGSGRR